MSLAILIMPRSCLLPLLPCCARFLARSGGQLLQQQLAPQESSYQSSRAEALHNVEATIVELGSIFTQLAEMVAAQGEMTQRIDENVEETLGNVDNAKAQLMKYLNNISGNRWLMMKVRGGGG
jgi:syntaxin 5